MNTFKLLISKYPYLHKIDKFYINIRTKEFYVKYNRKLQKVAGKSMDDEAFNEVNAIINEGRENFNYKL